VDDRESVSRSAQFAQSAQPYRSVRDTAFKHVNQLGLNPTPRSDEHQYFNYFPGDRSGFSASSLAQPPDSMPNRYGSTIISGHSQVLMGDVHGFNPQYVQLGDDDVSAQSLPTLERDYSHTTVSGYSRVHLGDNHSSAQPLRHLESFKAQIAALHPVLPPYLLERLAHSQVQRYARLLNDRVNHTARVSARSCTSGRYCHATGGGAELLPTQSSEHDAAIQFGVASNPDSDNDDSSYHGAVTPAMFPDGVPLPPTTKLPARFECPLCFQVKTFRRPSDWTKHVDEDLQPYVCTFATCTEPKTFKRSADWVRHENERHRRLEWWKCNHAECGHICYRKDDFIQHLVREHKLREPKLRRRLHAEDIPKSAAQKLDASEQEFWDRVDSCYHRSKATLTEEPCRFCGSVASSWKKLGVHVFKHMRQIAMPLLELVLERDVTDTITQLKAHSGGGSLLLQQRSLPPSRWVIQDVSNAPTGSGFHTDSGYVSLGHHLHQQGSDINDPQKVGMPKAVQDASTWDTKTMYSDAVSVETSRKDSFIERFAELLFKDLGGSQLEPEKVVKLCDGMTELLSDFAVRLGQGTPSDELGRAMVFIHKHRR